MGAQDAAQWLVQTGGLPIYTNEAPVQVTRPDYEIVAEIAAQMIAPRMRNSAMPGDFAVTVAEARVLLAEARRQCAEGEAT